jgi:hypothetical protein
LWILSLSRDEKNHFAKDETTAEYIDRKAAFQRREQCKTPSMVEWQQYYVDIGFDNCMQMKAARIIELMSQKGDRCISCSCC